MLRLLPIRFRLWCLKRLSKSLQRPVRKSVGSNLVGEGPDPCQLQIDAFEEAAYQLDLALTLLQERSMALMMCRMQNM